MSTRVHQLRRALRAELAAGRRVTGTFIKLATPDTVELAAAAGFSFVVVDLEHSTLGEAAAISLVRHADASGIAALVRLPAVDAPAIARLLENGAAGIQLSMLRTAEQARALRAATRFAPEGERSVSLTNRVAGFGGSGLDPFLRAEAASPPLLVGQIETAIDEPWPDVVGGLDVVFVGSTDLSVSLGYRSGDERFSAAVAAIRAAAYAAGAAFGGWSPTLATAGDHGLCEAGYLVVGSDLQILASGLGAAAPIAKGTGMTGRNAKLFGKIVNWADIPQTQLRRGVRRRVYATDEVMVAHHELAVGMDLNPHTHEDFDQLVYIASGRCNYYINGTAHDLTEGSFLLVPRGAQHYVEPTESPCVNIDIFVPPRADMLSELGYIDTL